MNATGGIGGARFELAAYDDVDAAYGSSDPDRALANVRAMAADDRVIAVVGANYSEVAFGMIRGSNEAGLLMCSPGVTDPGLTKPEYGAADLRSAQPDRPAFVRTSPSDDIQYPGPGVLRAS